MLLANSPTPPSHGHRRDDYADLGAAIGIVLGTLIAVAVFLWVRL